jgi:putative transposase
MKRFGHGVAHLGNRMPISSAIGVLSPMTHGISRRSLLTSHGERPYRWRAVDQDGHVLDSLVQRRRHKKAAKRCFRKLLKGCPYVPRVIVPDQLKRYGAAKRDTLPSVEHRQHRYLNNRAENSYQPTRQRARRMQGFKSPGHAQR